jgi:hypothetical protein
MFENDAPLTRDEFNKLRSNHQHTLVDFLRAELRLGVGFASMGNTEKALNAIGVVERFIDQVEDIVSRREINEELDELKSQLPSHLTPNP